jgi:hypothetical protein
LCGAVHSGREPKRGLKSWIFPEEQLLRLQELDCRPLHFR